MQRFEAYQPWHFSFGLSLLQRVALWLVWVAVSGLFLCSQRGRPPGLARLVVALPVLAANYTAPLLFGGPDEVLTTYIVAISSALITNLKLLAWVINRGTLLLPHVTRAQWLAVLALPILPSAPADVSPAGSSASEGNSRPAAGKQSAGRAADAHALPSMPTKGRTHETISASEHLMRFVRKLVLLSGMTRLLATTELAPIPHLLAQILSQYLVLSICCDGVAAVVSTALRLPVSPHFDSPYGSTSVRDFWSRWNQIVSHCLRSCVYEPLLEGRLVYRPGCTTARFTRTRRMLAVLASFLVSAVLHEGLFWYYAGRHTPHFLWFWFFVLWGPILVAENVGRSALRKRGVAVPTIVARVLTLALLHAMVGLFWFPPINNYGIMRQGAVNLHSGWQDVKAAVAARLA